jgi:hypothetical protein
MPKLHMACGKLICDWINISCEAERKVTYTFTFRRREINTTAVNLNNELDHYSLFI